MRRFRSPLPIRRFEATCCIRREHRNGTPVIGIEYRFQVGTQGATLTPRLDYTWQDDISLASNPVAGIVNKEDGRQSAYGVLNGRITWTAPSSAWTFSAYGLNLTNEYYFFGKLSLLGNSGREQGNAAPPREVGVNLRFNF